jgi:hypothetical protein
MKNILVLVLLLFSFCPLSAQENLPRHGLSADIGGSLGGTIKYNYRVIAKDKFQVTLSSGIVFGILTAGVSAGAEISLGHDRQFFAGISFDPMIIADDDDLVNGIAIRENLLIPKIGYRWQAKRLGEQIFLHAYLSPIIPLDDDWIIPWFGFGVLRFF